MIAGCTERNRKTLVRSAADPDGPKACNILYPLRGPCSGRSRYHIYDAQPHGYAAITKRVNLSSRLRNGQHGPAPSPKNASQAQVFISVYMEGFRSWISKQSSPPKNHLCRLRVVPACPQDRAPGTQPSIYFGFFYTLLLLFLFPGIPMLVSSFF